MDSNSSKDPRTEHAQTEPDKVSAFWEEIALRQEGNTEPPEAEERARPKGLAPQADGGKGHGCPSNTHTSSSHVLLSGYPEYTVSGGIDWFEWAAVVKWDSACYLDMLRLFEGAKAKCQAESKQSEWVNIVGTGDIRIGRTGLNRGGTKGQHFDYRVSYRGVTLGVAKRERATTMLPNVFVQMRGRDCLLLGALTGYEIIREFIAALGGTVREEILSRADMCLDVVGMNVCELQALVENHQFIGRGQVVTPHTNLTTNRKTGFSAGKNPLRLNAYDKIREQMGKRVDALYYQALVDRRWGGREPNQATRLEYQVSRQALKENGISTPNEFVRLQGALWQKLTAEWFRITDRPVDRKNKNQSRAITHALWTAIESAGTDIFGKPCGELIPIERGKVNPDRLLKQGRGCLRTALLQMGLNITTYSDFTSACRWALEKIVATPEEAAGFMEEYQQRATEHQCEG